MDDHSSASNTISVLTRIILNEAVLQLSKKIDKRESPYLMFRINKLYIDGAVTAYGMVMNACLGGIELVDKIHVGECILINIWPMLHYIKFFQEFLTVIIAFMGLCVVLLAPMCLQSSLDLFY